MFCYFVIKYDKLIKDKRCGNFKYIQNSPAPLAGLLYSAQFAKRKFHFANKNICMYMHVYYICAKKMYVYAYVYYI